MARVLVVAMTGVAPQHIGGPATIARHLVEAALRRGHEVTLLTRGTDATAASLTELLQGGAALRAHAMDVRYRLKDLVNVPRMVQWVGAATRLAEEARPHLVLYNSPPADVALRVPRRMAGRAPQVLNFHGGIANESRNHLAKAVMRRAIPWMDRTVAFSPAGLRLARGFGFPEDRLSLVRPGVDREAILSAPPVPLAGSPSFLCVGRLSRIKGVDDALEAFARVATDLPEARLHFVGEGPEGPALQVKARRLGLEARVAFHGYIEAPAVYGHFRGADVFVMSSHEESFGLTLLEAMTAGCACIATDIQGAPAELLAHGEAGLKVPPGDVEALAAAMREMGASRQRREALAAAARGRAMRYPSWTETMDGYFTQVERLL